MTNSKKNSKSVLALIVMSILLVASIVLAATGAWFTSQASDNKEVGFTGFGLVKVTATKPTITMREDVDLERLVDMETFQPAASYTNDSTVGVYYQLSYTLTVTASNVKNAANQPVEASTVQGYFTNNEKSVSTIKYAAAGADEDVITFELIKFDSDGALNGATGAVTIRVDISVKAIQAENLTVDQYNTFFGTSESELPAKA